MATSSPVSSPERPRPQSPGVGGVPLSSAIGNVLRFVLSSHASAGSPGDDPDGFPLSPTYCARLLDDDGELCRKLASVIEQCIEEGRIPGPPAVDGIPVAEEGPEEEWEAVLLEKGAESKLAVRKYRSFSEMLQAEIISNVLPGISSIEEGIGL
nr:unnamed protein product [Digitaria exilis]